MMLLTISACVFGRYLKGIGWFLVVQLEVANKKCAIESLCTLCASSSFSASILRITRDYGDGRRNTV